jgi:hypothetical protein
MRKTAFGRLWRGKELSTTEAQRHREKTLCLCASVVAFIPQDLQAVAGITMKIVF